MIHEVFTNTVHTVHAYELNEIIHYCEYILETYTGDLLYKQHGQN